MSYSMPADGMIPPGLSDVVAARYLRMKSFRLACLLALVLPTLATAQERRKGEPVRVIELAGSPAEIAAGYGKALAPEMRLLYEKYLKSWFTDDRTYRRAQAASFLFR